VKKNAWGKVIAEVDKGRSGLPQSLSEQPFVALGQSGSRKVAVILGYELWRWNFLLQGFSKDNTVYPAFFDKLIRWLVTREENKRVRIQVNKKIYRGGEPIEVTAQVYHEDYRPIDEAEVRVRIKNGPQEQEILLTGSGSGKYEGTVQLLEGGDYHYKGIASANEQLIGEDSGKFSVEPFSLEFLNTRMQETMLKKIATSTGGHYFTPADYRQLSQFIDFPAKRLVLSQEWELWNKIAMLIALLLFLAVEWFVRKKKGML